MGILSLALPPLDLVGFPHQMPVEQVPGAADRTASAISRYLRLQGRALI